MPTHGLVQGVRALGDRIKKPATVIMVIALWAWILGGWAWRAAHEANPWEVYISNPNLADAATSYSGTAVTLAQCRERADAYRMGWAAVRENVEAIQHSCVRRCWPLERGNVPTGDGSNECLVRLS